MFMVYKKWKKLARPNGWLLFFEVLTNAFAQAALTLSALPAAQVITNVTIIDFKGAQISALLVCVCAAIFCIMRAISLFLSAKQKRLIKTHLEDTLTEKIIRSPDADLKREGLTKINFIASNGVKTISGVSQEYSNWVGGAVQLAIVLGLLFSSNLILGSMVVGVSVIVCLIASLLVYIEGRVTARELLLFDKKNEEFDDLILGRKVASDLNIEMELSSEFKSASATLSKTQRAGNSLRAAREIGLFFLWNVFVLLATFYLIRLLRLDVISLTLFILSVPYLNQALNLTMNFYTIFGLSSNIKTEIMRLETLTQLPARELIFLGENTTDKLRGTLAFTSVTKHAGQIRVLDNLSFVASVGECTKITFKNPASKREFVNILRRASTPEIGTVTLDSINIFDFSKTVYPHNVSVLPAVPYFLNEPILNNLKRTGATKREIISVLKSLKIYASVLELKDGLMTILNRQENIDAYFTFKLGLSRAILTRAEVLVLIDPPNNFTPAQTAELDRDLTKISRTHNILIATTLPCPYHATKNINI